MDGNDQHLLREIDPKVSSQRVRIGAVRPSFVGQRRRDGGNERPELLFRPDDLVESSPFLLKYEAVENTMLDLRLGRRSTAKEHQQQNRKPS